MSYTNRPIAGVAMAKRSVVVIRGAKKPLFVVVKSKMAETSGVFVPMPTLFCAANCVATNRKKHTYIFFITQMILVR
jgi:hypothetical protein